MTVRGSRRRRRSRASLPAWCPRRQVTPSGRMSSNCRSGARSARGWRSRPFGKGACKTWLQEKIQRKPERSHGCWVRGQYEKQADQMVKDGIVDTGGEAITEKVVTDVGEASAGG